MESIPDPVEEIGDLSEGLLAVRLSSETRSFIRSKWTHALIVKVYGRSVGYHYLHSKIMSLWKPAGRLDCVDLGKDFYLMKFGLVEDFDNVLKGGPWFIGGHYLTIRAWEPNFKPSLASCDRVAVWVRLPELPFEYYEPCVLQEIGAAIGLVLRIDANTATGVRGRFARICVQIDLSKPLTRKILLEGVVQEVQYEGINALCFSCGRVGHRKEWCPYSVKETVPIPEPQAESPVAKSVVEAEEPNPQKMGKLVNEEEQVYGPWMIVRKKKSGAKPSEARDTSQKGDGPTSTVKLDDHCARAHPTDFPYVSNKSRESSDGKRKNRGLTHASSHMGKESELVHNTAPQMKSSELDFGLGNSEVGTTASVRKAPPGKKLDNAQKSNPRNLSGKDRGKGKTHGSKLQEPVGNISKWENYGPLRKPAQANKSKPNNDMGMVRSSRDDGLEQHFSFNAGEQGARIPSTIRPSVDGVGGPLVDIPIRHSNESRSFNIQLENSISTISGAKLESIRSGGRNCGKENMDIKLGSSEVLGKQELQKPSPSEPADARLQSSSKLTGNPSGDIAARGYNGGRGESLQEDDEGMGMEIAGPDECSKST